MLTKLFKQPFFWITVAIVLYMLPMLLSPHFSYIDDGYSLITAKQFFDQPLSEGSKLLLEPSLGRFRPAYYLYFFMLYFLFGVSPLAWWISNTVILILTAIGIWKLINQTAKINHKYIWWGLALFYLSPAVIENAYRLGPGEPRQSLFIIWFLVWLTNLKAKVFSWQQFLMDNLLFLLALTTKETSILLLPIIMVYFGFSWWRGKFKKPFLWLLAISLAGQVGLFWLFLPKLQGYAANASISVNKLWQNLLISRLDFAPFYVLALVALMLLVIRWLQTINKISFKKAINDFQWSLTYLIGFISSIFFIVGWSFQLERYYYLPLTFLALFCLQEISFFTKPVKKYSLNRNHLLGMGVMVVMVIFIILQGRGWQWHWLGQRSIKTFQEKYRHYQTAGSLTDYLYTQVPANTNIFMITNDPEVLAGSKFFASRLGDQQVSINNDGNAMENYNQSSPPKLLLTRENDQADWLIQAAY